MKNKIIIFLLTCVLLTSYSYGLDYSDTKNHWGNDYIYWVSNEINALQGYHDGTFRPDEYVTRGEFISLINKIIHIQNKYNGTIIKKENDTYSDIALDYKRYANIFSLKEYIDNHSTTEIKFDEIFSGNIFNLGREITRYEAALLARAITTPPLVTNYISTYKDLPLNTKYYTEINELVQNNIIKGYNDNSLRLNNKITRAEASVLGRKIYDDLEYLRINQLKITSIKESISMLDSPLFQINDTDLEQTDLNQRFINAITSLEYLDFIGYIPYNEEHLYDISPLETLWELKNKDYYNVIGVNYYLLIWDKNLVLERKEELIIEAINHYYTIDSKEVNDLYLFLKIASKYISKDQFIEIAESVFYDTKNAEEKLHIGEILVLQYLEENKISEAIGIYENMLEIETDIITSAILVKNYAYLMYKNSDFNSAIHYMNASWSRLRTHKEYAAHNEEVDYIFTSFFKQLKMRENLS
ncbi:S-layer homology domain-containing protein [Natronincola peptidivorans]|uniref:S-layer homology domain-containing protein n=1 Tax=Natronincola peptidivorans TaxID=426128 RepID=A0A1H9Z4W7_9FIRM|nr:S-layer homology domain-containing protein [Natronincola peptidivorans]SES76405.1 S-layer homology domain-containing protein [Natronincola peptidivorans]